MAMKRIIPSILVDKNLNIEFDPSQLKRVFSNLISNAIKYSDSGSLIFEANREKNLVQLSISDEGIGMTSDQLSKLFQPFTRFQRHLAEGAGLGLVVTQQLLEANHARIEVDSQYGSGTTFTLYLKASTKEPNRIPLSEVASQQIKLLYIEDSQDLRDSFIRSFESEKCKIFLAHNFVEAESIIRFQSFDGIICDRQTGQGTLLDFIQALSKKKEYSPILIISGLHSDLKIPPHFLRSFQVELIKKPADHLSIRQWVESLSNMPVSSAQLPA